MKKGLRGKRRGGRVKTPDRDRNPPFFAPVFIAGGGCISPLDTPDGKPWLITLQPFPTSDKQ